MASPTSDGWPAVAASRPSAATGSGARLAATPAVLGAAGVAVPYHARPQEGAHLSLW